MAWAYQNRVLSGDVHGIGILVNAVAVAAVKATGTITSSGTNVTANDTVTINGKVYTFVAAPTVEGDVDIGASAAATLDNLKAAINHTGTEGTDYVCAAAHPTVTATTNTDTVQTLEAITAGTAGNALTLAEVAATLTVSAATLLGGGDAAPTIHTALASTTEGEGDQVWLWADNPDVAVHVLKIWWGGTTAITHEKTYVLPATTSDIPLLRGRLIRNALVVKASCDVAGMVSIGGHANRITTA
jgi:hypothetical protein